MGRPFLEVCIATPAMFYSLPNTTPGGNGIPTGNDLSTPLSYQGLGVTRRMPSTLFSLFLLEQLNSDVEEITLWEAASQTQSDAIAQRGSGISKKEEAAVSTNTAKTTPKNNVAEKDITQVKVDVEAKRKYIEQEVASLQASSATPKLNNPYSLSDSIVTLTSSPPDIHFSQFSPQQQIWFQQWATSPGLHRSNGSDAIQPLNTMPHTGSHKGGTDKASTPTTSKAQGKPATTQNERIAFIQALQEQAEQAYKNGKPFRVQVDDTTSLILSLRDGEVSARFVLRNNDNPTRVDQLNQQLAQLQQAMLARELPVKQLYAETVPLPQHAMPQRGDGRKDRNPNTSHNSSNPQQKHTSP